MSTAANPDVRSSVKKSEGGGGGEDRGIPS